MATQVQSAGWGYRLGRGARRVLRGYGRIEHRVARWLMANGLPAGLTLISIWTVRFAIAGALLYVAFWLALLIAVVTAAALATDESASTEKDGWPFMTKDELRTSMFYDPVLHNDVAHEQFKED